MCFKLKIGMLWPQCQKKKIREERKGRYCFQKFTCCNFSTFVMWNEDNVHSNGCYCKITPDTDTITVHTLLCTAHKLDYLYYIFIFPQFSPNWTLRRGPCDMPAYCLFPRVQHHLHGSGKAASLWRWQMGQGHSLLKRCASQLQVEFAWQALWPVCIIIDL